MSEYKDAIELNDSELDEVTGGTNLGEDGWNCPNCNSTSTEFVRIDNGRYHYVCENCFQAFDVC